MVARRREVPDRLQRRRPDRRSPSPSASNIWNDWDYDGILSDDERDFDSDGLANIYEYWSADFQPWEPSFPGTLRPDYIDPDTDGDGVLDGWDDQDHDDVSNIDELSAGHVGDESLRPGGQPHLPALARRGAPRRRSRRTSASRRSMLVDPPRPPKWAKAADVTIEARGQLDVLPDVPLGSRSKPSRRRRPEYGSPLPLTEGASDHHMPKTAIIGAARTPFGKLGGGLSPLDATDLGGKAIEAALERAEVKGEEVQHVVFGQVLQAGQGQIPSRQAQIKGGIPKEVSSETVNKVCASGIRGVGILDQAIRAGDLEVGVGGGMESMSNAPYLLKQARFGYRMGDAKALDAMINDGLTNPFSGKHMAQEASEVAAELEMTRADMDKFALRSHELAIAATEEGRLPEEIVPVTISSKKGDTTVEVDEAPRADTNLETLSKLPPIFLEDGTHTAGNAPGVNDGAGALVVASDEWAKANGKQVLATVVAQAQVADDFPYLARTPANATKAALEKAGLSVDDIDLFEINEAFASVALNSMRMLEVPEEKVNVNGGAIALGHPIGASGARILMTLVNELRRRGGGLGVAAICSGGGQGDAVIVEVNGS